MENNQPQTATIKNLWVTHIEKRWMLIKKIVKWSLIFIFPWPKLLSLKRTLQKLLRENSIYFNELNIVKKQVNKLKEDGKVVLFPHDHSPSKIMVNEIAGLLNWPEIQTEQRKHGFVELMRLLELFSSQHHAVMNPSNCWILLAAKNCDQLLNDGYHNFKRTIAHNYFNFLVQKGDIQIQSAESQLSKETIKKCGDLARVMPSDPTFKVADSYPYYYFIFLLWEYVKKIDVQHYLNVLSEPLEGNPLLVHANGKSISQDLANSLIEYYAIDAVAPFKNNISTILEIGGGYGRNAHVILSLNPNAKMIMVDIFPALYIAQRYLSSVFNDRKIFMARDFTSFEEVKDEIEAASIIFLMPNQLALLPDKWIDLCMNISSFGEMNVAQITWYFNEINRLCKKYFYTKQWQVSKNPFDALELKQADYPYLANWKPVYSRPCAIQTEFFESLFQVS